MTLFPGGGPWGSSPTPPSAPPQGMPSWMNGQTPSGPPNSSSPAIWGGISGQGNPFGPPPGTTAPQGYTPTPTGAGGVNGQPPPAGWNGGPPPGLGAMGAMGAGGPPQQFSPAIQAAIAAAVARPNPTPYSGPPIAPGGVTNPNFGRMNKQAVPGMSLNSNPLMGR